MPDDRPDLRLVAPAVSVWLITWLGHLAPPAVLVALGCVALVAAALLLQRRGLPHRSVVAATCACAAAACVVTGLHVGSRTTGPLPELAREQAAVTVVGTLTADPRPAVPRTPAHAAARDLVVVELRVEQVEARGRTHVLRSPALVLSTDPNWLGLLPSQRVRTEGLLRPAERGDDVAVVLSARGRPSVLTGPSRLQRAAGHLREGLRDAVAPLPSRERGLLPGLVVGDDGALDGGVRDDFRAVGLTHLTAVSGTNCSIVAGAVLLLCVRLGVGLRARPVAAGLALAGFVVLARPDPSVLRAAVMGAVGLLALATGTRRAAVPALCTAVLVLLLLDPDLAGTAGFALSVLATAGLLVLAPPWTRVLRRRLPLWLAASLAVPAAAFVACGPVVVALSSQVGLLTVPANMLAAPAVAPATVLGVLAAVAAPVAMPFAQALAWLAYPPTAWLVRIADVGAGLPGATVPWPGGGTGAALMLVVTLALLLVLARRRLRAVALAAATGVVVATGGLAAARPAWPPPGWFAVACDVGQGDAVVLAAGPGSAVVVDAGGDPAAVDGCLRRLRVGTVPVVLLTHLHADHVLGLPGVLRGRRVGLVQVGPSDEPAEQQERVARWARAAGVPVARPGLGELRRAGRLVWEVLAPARVYRGTRSDPNNASLVVRVTVGGTRLLLTGDVEPEAQGDLLERGTDLRADVLKVPHHGSPHQEPAFLDAVAARVVVTSVGADNTYGHPAPTTLARLTARGALSYRTDLHGDVALVLRGGQLGVVARRGAAPAAAAAVEAWTPCPPTTCSPR
ncbi:MAG: ComEC/Rec2 family competence protein [Actinomycetes bacterium]